MVTHMVFIFQASDLLLVIFFHLKAPCFAPAADVSCHAYVNVITFYYVFTVHNSLNLLDREQTMAFSILRPVHTMHLVAHNSFQIH